MREYSFNLEAARRYGVDGAVLLQGMAAWITKNRANERHFHDGRWWTYNSQEALTRLFPFWTRRQIQRIVKALNEEGALLLGQYSDGLTARTTWYSLSDDVLRLLGAEECASAGEEGAAEGTAPNGAIPGGFAPNGAEVCTERCELNRKQIDTTVTPYSPPSGGGAQSVSFGSLLDRWTSAEGARLFGEQEDRRAEKAYLELQARGLTKELLERIPVWIAAGAPAVIPLSTVLRDDAWKEDPLFWSFWRRYPRKIDKDRARRAWKRLKPGRELAVRMLDSLEAWKRCEQWQDERLIPYPATWLNNRRWEARPPDRRAGPPPEAGAAPREPEEWT